MFLTTGNEPEAPPMDGLPRTTTMEFWYPPPPTHPSPPLVKVADQGRLERHTQTRREREREKREGKKESQLLQALSAASAGRPREPICPSFISILPQSRLIRGSLNFPLAGIWRSPHWPGSISDRPIFERLSLSGQGGGCGPMSGGSFAM